MNRSDYLHPEKEEIIIQDIGPEVITEEYEIGDDSEMKEANDPRPADEPEAQSMFYSYSSITPFNDTNTYDTNIISGSIGISNSQPVSTWPVRSQEETDASYIESVLRRALEVGEIRDANVRSIIYRACDNLARYHDPRMMGPRVDPF